MTPSEKKNVTLGMGGGAGIMLFGFFVPGAFLKGLLIALAVVCLLAVGYWAFCYLRRRRQIRESETDVQDLLRQVGLGMETLRKHKVKLYDIPWYLMMGEPAAGKTFACRALFKQIHHPEGVTDAMQGTGGTHNLDWWFYEDLVVLDTAGRIVFQETPEWRALLRGLAKKRPDYPINGVMLVIPADSLLKDNEEKIREKASRIRHQLNLVKTELDLRFPVYILITKADLLTGFREFAIRLPKEESRNQIFGWSSEEKNLDVAFDPRQTGAVVEQVVQALRRRCLPLVWDRNGQNSLARRIDEVDDIFCFPNAVKERSASLSLYLNEIFGEQRTAGAQPSRYKTPGAKTLFVRGIYFTSTVQEGPVYDPETARKFGLDPEVLAKARPVIQQGKVYFLRKLVLDKILPEKDLVTSLDDLAHARRVRIAAMLGAVGVALLVLGLIIGLNKRGLARSLADDIVFWRSATNALAQTAAKAQPTPERLLMASLTVPDQSELANRLEFHRRLAWQISTPLRDVPWVFRMFRFSDEPRRQRAQWHVFKQDFAVPLVSAVQEEMARPIKPEENWSGEKIGRLQAVLLSMVHLETDWTNHYTNPENAATLLNVCYHFLADTNGSTERQGPDGAWPVWDAVKWTLSTNKNRQTEWPWPELSRGTSFDANDPIKGAVNNLLKIADYRNTKQRTTLDHLKGLQAALIEFDEAEKRLQELLRAQSPDDGGVGRAVEAVGRAAMKARSHESDLEPFPNFLAVSVALRSELAATSKAAFGILITNLPRNCPSDLCRRVSEALGGQRSPMFGEAALLEKQSNDFDEKFLSKVGETSAYRYRSDFYTNTWGQGQGQIFNLGDEWKRYTDGLVRLASNRAAVANYLKDSARERFVFIGPRLADLAGDRARRQLKPQYVEPASRAVAEFEAALKQRSADWLRQATNAAGLLLKADGDLTVLFSPHGATPLEKFEFHQRTELTNLHAAVSNALKLPMEQARLQTNAVDTQGFYELLGEILVRPSLALPVRRGLAWSNLVSQTKLDWLFAVLTADSTCKLSLDFTGQSSEVNDAWRHVYLSAPAVPTTKIYISGTNFIAVGTLGVDSRFKLGGRETPEGPLEQLPELNFGPWGIVQLLLDPDWKQERVDVENREVWISRKVFIKRIDYRVPLKLKFLAKPPTPANRP